MRARGINYDTGFINAGTSTRESFDPGVVRREMQIIHDDLHCTAVRITGGDPERLEIAAGHAAGAGLEVWFCPFTCDLTVEETLEVISDCAERAERIRRRGAEVVFLTGSELSLFTEGFLPGDTFTGRVAYLRSASPARLRELLAGLPSRFNGFLGEAVALARERFGGRISYASLPSEGVDWTPFDIVSTDAGYRSTEDAEQYREGIRALTALGKPVAVTEFGCMTHVGAASKASDASEMIEYDGSTPIRLNGDYVRDEQEQAAYLREQLDLLDGEGVDAAFVYTFARYDLPHRAEPRDDLDMASMGVVKVCEDRPGDTYPGMPWEPKAAFAALADYYRDV
ncbi:hypothetical protein Rxycam_01366 [Rubrobacter xylanophilus DSM 9941]|uniref:hypothetical protein n=1 Tax=Rubrobacter xylanophilus TaxID=49319 RepID=UPI001C640F5C|nr:hypothetical protein [Rubrobacter xylanophilus]QYJ15542.1 hypothetical protein Rxycam_01366 [Rubrobacter xylanophilus DSM 9941]